MDLDQDPEELELKKKARRRLVGAVALVLVVVILVPMLLDDERRPLPEDVEIVRSSGERISLKSAEEPQPAIEGQENKTLDPREEDIDQPADASTSVSVVSDQVEGVSKYFVQLGVFSNFEKARIYAKKVEKNKFEVVSRELEGASKPRMKILVGPFSDKEGAEQALKRLEARKLTYGDAKIVEFE